LRSGRKSKWQHAQRQTLDFSGTVRWLDHLGEDQQQDDQSDQPAEPGFASDGLDYAGQRPRASAVGWPV
jgi:hypothetical protein